MPLRATLLEQSRQFAQSSSAVDLQQRSKAERVAARRKLPSARARGRGHEVCRRCNGSGRHAPRQTPAPSKAKHASVTRQAQRLAPLDVTAALCEAHSVSGQPTLYPAIAPYDSGFLRVSPIHELYWEQSG